MDKAWRGKGVIMETTGVRHMARRRIQGKSEGDGIYW
jgi:hypothetical protein